MAEISAVTLRRLDIQGFEGIDDERLAETGRWLRLAFGLCSLMALTGTLLASPIGLWMLVPIAALGAAFPVHPFDYIYNYGLRHLTGTGPLPHRGAPSRINCGIATVWLIATASAFQSEAIFAGYVLGGLLVVVGGLVSTIDFCIPSLIYRSIFGFPQRRGINNG